MSGRLGMDRRRRLPGGVRRALLPAALAFAVVASVFLSGCIAGGGTDVGNPDVVRVTGSLKYADGSVVPNLPVHLRAAGYLHPDSGSAAMAGAFARDRNTDSQGFFAFDSIPLGDYRIEAVDSAGKGALVDIAARAGGGGIDLAPSVLVATGTLAGSINYLGTIGPVYPKIAIALYGTDRVTYATSDGGFILSDLPAGSYRLRIFTDSASTEVPSATVEPGGRTLLPSVDLGP